MRRLRPQRREPTKFELAEVAWQTTPCPNCGRDLRVPATYGAMQQTQCICGAAYEVWIARPGSVDDEGNPYTVSFQQIHPKEMA